MPANKQTYNEQLQAAIIKRQEAEFQVAKAKTTGGGDPVEAQQKFKEAKLELQKILDMAKKLQQIKLPRKTIPASSIATPKPVKTIKKRAKVHKGSKKRVQQARQVLRQALVANQLGKMTDTQLSQAKLAYNQAVASPAKTGPAVLSAMSHMRDEQKASRHKQEAASPHLEQTNKGPKKLR